MVLELGLQLDHVAVTVPDLEAAVEWYCTIFGFSVAWREDWTDAPAQPLGLPVRQCGFAVPASMSAQGSISNCMRCRRRGPLSARSTRQESAISRSAQTTLTRCMPAWRPPACPSSQARTTSRSAGWLVSAGSTRKIPGG